MYMIPCRINGSEWMMCTRDQYEKFSNTYEISLYSLSDFSPRAIGQTDSFIRKNRHNSPIICPAGANLREHIKSSLMIIQLIHINRTVLLYFVEFRYRIMAQFFTVTALVAGVTLFGVTYQSREDIRERANHHWGVWKHLATLWMCNCINCNTFDSFK